MNREIREAVAQAEAGHGSVVKGLMGKVMLGAAFLTCPCHLPIYLVLFGGTALGGYLTENMALVAGVLTAAFLISLLTGIKMVKARK